MPAGLFVASYSTRLPQIVVLALEGCFLISIMMPWVCVASHVPILAFGSSALRMGDEVRGLNDDGPRGA